MVNVIQKRPHSEPSRVISAARAETREKTPAALDVSHGGMYPADLLRLRGISPGVGTDDITVSRWSEICFPFITPNSFNV
jgi:hypothetical protein